MRIYFTFLSFLKPLNRPIISLKIDEFLLILQNYILNNLDKKKLTQVVVDAIQDKKGTGINIINLSKIPTAPASEFIICQGKTPSQTTAIAENIIEESLKQSGRKPARTDGMRNGQWIIVDFGETMIHVFTPDFREFYNIEDLWSDGELTRVPDID